MVKTRLVRLAGKGAEAAVAHLRYIQRDGVTRDGEPGASYSGISDAVDGRAFLRRCEGDRHQFRFIVSAEDGSDYEDLKPLTRRLMAQMESDLGTKLDWVAVDHFNTGHPHTHIMLRGKNDRGDNLVIAREYIAHGMRGRLTELVTLDLGPRSDREIARKLQLDVGAERLTPLDRRLLPRLDADRTIRPSARDPHFQTLEAGRLQVLGSLGLAREVVPGRWRLEEDIETRLRALGERGDIIRTMQRELARVSPGSESREQRIRWPGEDHPPLVGRIVARGLSDEHRDRHYLIVQGVDGASHYVDCGRGDALGEIDRSAIVRMSQNAGSVEPNSARERPVKIEVLSNVSLETLVGADAATWLDKELVAERPEPLRDAGFGSEVRRAKEMRRQWLLAQGLAKERGGSTAYRPDLLSHLEHRELNRTAQMLAKETGLDHSAGLPPSRIAGVCSRRIVLISGSYAMIENSREFSLVPWHRELERHLGRRISGGLSRNGISWSLGRKRDGPSIS